MKYRFAWLIDTKNYQDIVCAVEASFDWHAAAASFGYELLKTVQADTIRVYSADEPVWFIR